VSRSSRRPVNPALVCQRPPGARVVGRYPARIPTSAPRPGAKISLIGGTAAPRCGAEWALLDLAPQSDLAPVVPSCVRHA
jgi:hypothetical protein